MNNLERPVEKTPEETLKDVKRAFDKFAYIYERSSTGFNPNSSSEAERVRVEAFDKKMDEAFSILEQLLK